MDRTILNLLFSEINRAPLHFKKSKEFQPSSTWAVLQRGPHVKAFEERLYEPVFVSSISISFEEVFGQRIEHELPVTISNGIRHLFWDGHFGFNDASQHIVFNMVVPEVFLQPRFHVLVC